MPLRVGKGSVLRALPGCVATIGDGHRMTLFDAIDRADFGLVWQLVQSKQGLRDIDDESGLTPLALAAQEGLTEIVRTLIEAGADPNHGGSMTPLEAAVLEGDPEIVKMMISAGAVLDGQSPDGQTALMSAAMTGDIDMVDLLLQAGARVRIENGDGDTAIDLAEKYGFGDLAHDLRTFSRQDFEAEKAALEARLEEEERQAIERRRRERRERVEKARQERAQKALEEGVTGPDSAEDATPGAADSARPSVEAGSAFESPDAAAETAHSFAPEAEEKAAPEVEAPRTAGEARGVFDALFGDLEPVSKAPSVNVGKLKGMARFRALVEQGDETAAIAMVAASQIGLRDRHRGETPLMIAAAAGAVDVTVALLGAGAPPDDRDSDASPDEGETALVKAIRSVCPGRESVIRHLVEAGADLGIRFGDSGITPLMVAAEVDVYEPDPSAKLFGGTVKLLVELGADIEATDENGQTVWRRIKRSALGALTSSPFRRRLFQMLKVLESEGAATPTGGR